MQVARPAIALDPRCFGRRRARTAKIDSARANLVDDLKLFAATFLAGFVFVSILIS
jgi:hypothetical protein